VYGTLPHATPLLRRAVNGRAKEITAYLEKKSKEVADDAEFQKIMKDIGQPVMYQNAEEYKAWFKQAYDQFGTLYKSLGIDTK
jgi:tripartite-type tricarboxylate transporter receptor subunit TctC